MKKIISLLLCMVMIFSFAMPSFAIGDNDTELDALNSIDYYVYWMFQDFSEDLEDLKTWNLNSMNQLLDINDFSRSIFNELSSLNNNLFGETSFITPFADSILTEFSSLNDEFKFFSDSFFNGISWGEPFAEVVQDNLNDMNYYLGYLETYLPDISGTLDNLNSASLTLFGLASSGWKDYSDSWYTSIYNDVHQLKEVLADDEDLSFKESQKENQQYIQDTFFNPGSALSLDVSKLTDFTKQFTDFTESFNFIEEVGTSTSPLESISEGSDFSQWFTAETGQSMDPTFNGGSGGGGGEDPTPTPTLTLTLNRLKTGFLLQLLCLVVLKFIMELDIYRVTVGVIVLKVWFQIQILLCLAIFQLV
ncbi:MAG: hypothetical protein IKK14_05920 [Oscillospiraceae bacterium]|nr:hypothetical protein [Oscillospiraceae bacterium]